MHSYWYIQDIQALQHDTKTKTMLFPKRIKPVKELLIIPFNPSEFYFNY